jgi:hypothetical protein
LSAGGLLLDFDNIHSSLRGVDPAAARVFATDPMRWSSWLEGRLGAVGPDADETTPRVVQIVAGWTSAAEASTVASQVPYSGWTEPRVPSPLSVRESDGSLSLTTHRQRFTISS